MRLQAAILLLAAVVPSSHAIFADEAFHIDYHHALLGTPRSQTTFFHKPSASSPASLLYTLSEKLVLGAVNPKDGAIVWRQNLAESAPHNDETEGFLRAAEGEDIVVSAVGGDVSSWGAADGKLSWDNHFNDGPVRDLEILQLEEGNAAKAQKDAIVLFGNKHGVLRRLDGASGLTKWEYKDDSDDVPFQVSTSPTSIYYISLQSALLKGYKIKVTALDPQTGKVTKQTTLSSESEVSSPESILLVGANTASPLIVWADKDFKTLKINVIGTKHINTVNVENKSGEDVVNVRVHAPHVLNSLPHFLIQYETKTKSWAEVYHTDLKSSTISKAYQLPLIQESSVFATSNIDANVYFTRITPSEITLVSSASHGVLGRWTPKTKLGEQAKHAVSEVVPRSGSTYAIRFAEVLESGDWVLIRNGEPEWTRPESLAETVAATWADVNGGEELAHELELEGHESLYGAYMHRLRRHARDLQRHFPSWLQQLPLRVFSSFLPGDGLDLSQFGFDKLVIVATRRGRVAAIDSGRHGAVKWNIQVSETDWDIKSISAAHGIATIIVDDGSFVMMNITSGEITGRGPPSEQLSSVVVIPRVAASSVAIGIGADGTPDFPPDVFGAETFIVTTSKDGRVLGWNSANKASPVWEFVPPKGQKLIDITSRPEHDPVASIGKVLGNRSVLYKYLNPNLALVTTVTDNTASFYLLDGVSGQVLHSVTHTGVDTKQPIASALSENWFAYSLGVDVTDTSDTKGYELVISELYESPIPNDRGPLGDAANYTSIRVARPHVISQAFMIPEPISHMSVTQTRQGITLRQLLCTLPASNAIIGIPRPALDPRRPVGRDPTSTEAEEGLVKYNPLLDFNPTWYLTHAREVFGVRAIESSQTLMESTSLVFAYGLDIFGTRVTPSQAFDILGKGFSKVQLLLTVVALAAGVGMLAPLARAKQVNMRWKS